MTPPKRLVILAPNWLGDAVMALPLIADLRRAWPETEMAVAGRRSVVPLFEMVRGLTHTITLAPARGVALPRATAENVRLLAGGGFDAALLLPNSFISAWIATRAGIPQRWGFARDLRRPLLTLGVTPPRDLHQAAYYQALGTALGVAAGPLHARIEVAGDDRRRARELLEANGVQADDVFVAMAPGAAYGRAKQWPPERFAELAAQLRRDGVSTVLVGSHGDAGACRDVAANSHAIDLAGRTDLALLAAILQSARAVVANDSGAMHLAAAVGTKVVGIFGPTDDRKTAPLRAGDDATAASVVVTDVWCRPCLLRECPIDHRCMTRISAQRVREQIAG
jgi:heptosyltransferase-2